MAADKRTSIYFPDPKVREKAEKAAEKDGRSLSDWIVRLIEKAVS